MKKRSFFSGSVHNPEHLKMAAQRVARGEPVAFENGGVMAIWGDGRSDKFIKTVWSIKGEGRKGRPMALTLKSKDFVKLIDHQQIHPSQRAKLKDYDRLTRTSGSLFFWRVPINSVAVGNLPGHVVSEDAGIYVIQNWDPVGHKPAENFIREMEQIGIVLPAITSLNVTGEPEIVDAGEAEIFCREHGIFLLLDSNDKRVRKGSYPIVQASLEGLKLVRHGNIPHEIIESVLEETVNTIGAKDRKYPLAKYPEEIIVPGNPEKTRLLLIQFLNGDYKN